MNVKKIITLLLALVLAAGMVACGTKPAEDTDGKDGSEEAGKCHPVGKHSSLGKGLYGSR